MQVNLNQPNQSFKSQVIITTSAAEYLKKIREVSAEQALEGLRSLSRNGVADRVTIDIPSSAREAYLKLAVTSSREGKIFRGICLDYFFGGFENLFQKCYKDACQGMEEFSPSGFDEFI